MKRYRNIKLDSDVNENDEIDLMTILLQMKNLHQ